MTSAAQGQWDGSKMVSYFTTASFILLLGHIYYECYDAFAQQGQIGEILGRIQNAAAGLHFVADDTICKLCTLLVLLPSCLPLGRPSDRKVGYKVPLIFLGAGLLIYFSTADLTPVNGDRISAYCYIAITGLGYLIIVGAASRLSASIRYAFSTKRFQDNASGFRQEKQLITTGYSLNFRAKYGYNGRNLKSYINIVNPRRGVLIMGFPGCGKSWFIIEPVIEQLTQKGLALFVYDFKFPTLSEFTYNCFLKQKDKYPPTTRFYCINFTDLSRSYRCNIIDPKTLEYKNDAVAISRTIMLSMNRTWHSKQGDFFIESPINFLAALIWFLRVYKNGIYCTLPHVIELSKISYDELFTILNAEPSTRGLIVAFKDAFLNKTTEMLDGQIASARIPLGRLDSPDFYYVLSGNDVSLDINDPIEPAVLCLGGDSAKQDALAPVMSLYIDRLNKRINQPYRRPTGMVLDEFATVRATSVLSTIATGRSNNIVTVLAVQDLSQLKSLYTHDEAAQVMNTAGNLICGQIAGETARWVSERFHANVRLKTTISVNSSDTSTSKTEQSVEAVTPATLANLSSGEFVGVLSDDPDVKLELKGFHSTIVKDTSNKPAPALSPLPIIAEVDNAMLDANYCRIGKDVADLVQEEMKRILGDPSLRKFIVKR
jgi:hypothetical protein